MNHTIIPLYNGSFSVSFGKQEYIPAVRNIHSFCFLVIDRQGHPILIDTGFSRHYIPGVESEYQRETIEELSNAIRKFGYSTNDIDTVIQTHLHWDHTGGMALFRSARFFIQVRELEYIANIPTPAIEECAFWPPHWLELLPNFELLHGSKEIKPGVQVIWTGEHTAGHQAVKIQTSAGDVILGGDAPFNYDHMHTDIPEEFWLHYQRGPGKDFFWPGDVRPLIRQFLEKNNQPHQAVPEKQYVSQLKSRQGHFFTSHDPKLLKIKSIPTTK